MRFFSFSMGGPNFDPGRSWKLQVTDQNVKNAKMSSPIYDQKHVFYLSVTYDLDLWPKILKIILHNEHSTSNMYVKFQNNRIETVVCRARSGLRTDTQTPWTLYSLSARLIMWMLNPFEDKIISHIFLCDISYDFENLFASLVAFFQTPQPTLHTL